MRVIIKNNFDDTSYWVAVYLKHKIIQHNRTKPKIPFILGLPTGSTPLGVYRYLIKFHQNGFLSFKNVITFNMDEYVGLPPDNTQSYHYFMYSNFFNYIDIPKENINILNGLSVNLQEECNKYEEKIKSVGGIDIFLAGIGSDGHIAFNEPGSSLQSKTRIKTLCLETITDNARFFDSMNDVPTQALTVGLQTVFSAKKVIIMASGIKKSIAIRECLEGPISSQYTCTVFQNHPKCIIVCDELASREIKHKNYLYYKNLQENIDLYGRPIQHYLKKYISDDDKILITSPHPDDDVIGMGGTMSLIKNKSNVKICYMTNGLGGLKDGDNLGNHTRLKEAMSSILVLGYKLNQGFDAELPFYYTNSRTVSNLDYDKMNGIINEYDPQHIFICIDTDPNKTHIKCAQILQQCKFNKSLKNIWLYQSAWGNWKTSEIKSNIGIYINKEEFKKKLLSIDMHISQYQPKVTKEEKIDSFKDIVLKQNKSELYPGNYEEKFRIVDKNEFVKLKKNNEKIYL